MNFLEGYPVPARGRSLNKPCVVKFYNDANLNPEESDGTTTLFSFLDVNRLFFFGTFQTFFFFC